MRKIAKIRITKEQLENSLLKKGFGLEIADIKYDIDTGVYSLYITGDKLKELKEGDEVPYLYPHKVLENKNV